MKKKCWMFIFLFSVALSVEVVGRTATEREQIAILADIKNKALPSACRTKKVQPIEFSRTTFLEQKRGVFVTLYKDGKLRGCIGRIYAYDEPLYKTIPLVAQLAALEDPRFSSVECKELPAISVSVSVLSKPEKVLSYKKIKLGRDGIILRKGGKSAVFLPKVPIDNKWTREETLRQLSRKAGLSSEAWKDRDTTFEVFESYDFPDVSSIAAGA